MLDIGRNSPCDDWGRFDTNDFAIISTGSQPVNYHNQSVDIYYMYDELDGLNGRASCEHWVGTICNHWHVVYDDQAMVGDTPDQQKHVACHETGHATGLKHPSVNNHGWGDDGSEFACMRNMSVRPSPLGAHNAFCELNGYLPPGYFDCDP